MRTILVLVLSLLCAPGLGKDFREMDLGGDCARVRDLEEHAGSSLLHSDDTSYTFIGVFQGWPVTIHYQCRGGRFVEGMYLFDESSPGEATALFGAIKRLVVAERGAPTVDWSVPEHRRGIEEGLGKKLDPAEMHYCEWRTALMEARLSAGPLGPDGWRVSLSIESRRTI